MSDIKKKVEELIAKAVASHDGGEAQKYAQAALNAAHAVQTLALMGVAIDKK